MHAPSFDQQWNVISGTAEACRGFNELQFKYRQMAISIIFAAFLAMGYFWSSTEAATKAALDPGFVSEVSREASVGVSASAANLSQGTPALRVRVYPADQNQRSSSIAIDAHKRIDVILVGFGFISGIATVSIWALDCLVYHRILRSMFDAAHRFEINLVRPARAEPPLFHIRMAEELGSSGWVVAGISIFYFIGAIVGMFPAFAYTYLTTGPEQLPYLWAAQLWFVLIAAVGLFVLCRLLWSGWRK